MEKALGIKGKTCRPEKLAIKLKGQGRWKSGEENSRAKAAFVSVKFWLRTGVTYSV